MKAYQRAATRVGVALRPMRDADLAFCETLYASTRWEELAPLAWPEAETRRFLASQHALQHQHYRKHYDGAEWWIIKRDGDPVGRLYLFESASEIRIVDIALLPAARGTGIGGALLAGVQAHAAANGRNVTIHVEKNNPARTLYLRLGFEVIDTDRGAYDFLEWRPRAAAPDSAQLNPLQ